MHARQTTVRADPANVDSAIEQVRRDVLPALEAADGFKGFTLMADRDTGLIVGTSYFETQEAVMESENAIRGPREETAKQAGGQGLEVRFFEVVIDIEK